MSLLSASDLAKAYGAQDVFQGVTLAIAHQSRTALVGPNGVGKSTLLALLAGRERPDRGRIQRARGLRLGFLPQDGASDLAGEAESDLVLERCLQAFDDLRRRERELTRLEAAMSDPRSAEEALAAYGPLQESFEHDGGYTYMARVRRHLRGLGIGSELWDRRLAELSGGERARVALARLLLDDPDLLLLDEPTNHLDLDAMEWLEGWLRDWPGAALIVSHDRFFLDRTVNQVWELDIGGLTSYRGDYRAYVRQRSERSLEHERAYSAQQEHRRREEEFIRRNLAGQNTRQAKGRRKRLERLLEEQAVARPVSAATPVLEVRSGRRGGEQILETHGLVIAHPSTGGPLLAVPDLVLQRGECVAVLGPNGAGKSSLLRTLVGDVPPLAGEVRLGSGIRTGYLSQTEAELDPERSVLDAARETGLAHSDGELRSWLARFGLADDAEKIVSQLSGGERRRLALSRLASAGANLLLLDEPTNNLDLLTQEALQQALESYPETVLLATHDRYLASGLATQIWTLSPDEASLEVFHGRFEDFQRRRPPTLPSVERTAARTDRPAVAAAHVKEAARLELEVERAEAELAALGRQIDDAGGDVEAVTRLGLAYAEQERAVEALLQAWSEAARQGSA